MREANLLLSFCSFGGRRVLCRGCAAALDHFVLQFWGRGLKAIELLQTTCLVGQAFLPAPEQTEMSAPPITESLDITAWPPASSFCSFHPWNYRRVS